MAVLKQGVDLVKATFKDFSQDEATWKAAALAYFTVFALPPLLVLLLQVASAIWDPVEVRRTLTGEFQSLMGQDVTGQIQTMITQAEQKVSGTGFRLVLSIAGLIFGATGAFVSLQSALNRAWEVEPDPRQGGIKRFITKRFLSLGMVLGIAFLLLVSLALTSALSAVGDRIFGGSGSAIAQVLNFVLSFAVVTLLFAAIFKILPDAKIAWRDVWVGAVVTAVLFVIGKFLIGLYIGQSDPGNAFGAAGSLAVLLVWIYYASVIVLLGAEFTQAWVKQRGRKIEPEEGAVRVVERKERVGESRSARTEKSEAGAARSDREAETTADIRAELALTRNRMSETVVALEEQVAGATASVKQTLGISAVIRRHPWSALAVAGAAGLVLRASRADEKVAAGAVRAAKRAPKTVAATLKAAGQQADELRRPA